MFCLCPNKKFFDMNPLSAGCLTLAFAISDWNPMWSVGTIVQGIQSFMCSDELTTGGLRNPPSEHKKFAAASAAYNAKMFPNLFGGDMEAAFALSERARIQSEAISAKTEGSRANRRTRVSRSSRSNNAPDEGKEEEEQDGEENNEAKGGASKEEEEGKVELTPEEIEKRRKKNAKKRARQKAKKAAAAQQQQQQQE